LGILVKVYTWPLFAAGALTAIVGTVTVAIVISLPIWVILYGTFIILIIVPPTLDLMTGRFDLLEARNVVAGYLFLEFGLGIVNTIFLGQREYVDQADFMRMLPTALLYVNIGLILFYLGYYLPIGKDLAEMLPLLKASWKPARVGPTILIISVVGLLIYARLLVEQGGLASMLRQEQQLAASQTGKYYLILLGFRLPLLATVICYLWARTSDSGSFRLAALGLLAITFGMGATLGARGAPIRTVVACLAAAHYTAVPKRVSTLVTVTLTAAVAVVLIVVLAVQTTIRAGGYLPGFSAGKVVTEASESSLQVGLGLFVAELTSRFMAYEEFERILDRVGHSVEPQNGKTFFEAIYGLVPRAIWPEKPDGVGMIGGEVFLDYAAVGQIYWFPTLTWLGELYWNFFSPGIVIGMLATGIFCRAVYAYLRRNLNASAALLYVPMLLFFEAFAVGGIGAELITLLALLGPTTCAYVTLTA
jgi:hypothetical protein